MRRTDGFSMVELLVALTFVGVLMAGMARVFTASLGSFARASESISAQRALRTTVDLISDDMQMMGYCWPPVDTRVIPVAASSLTTVQSAFMIIPGQPIRKLAGTAMAVKASTEDPFEPSGKTVDELTFVMDMPLPYTATVSAIQKMADANAPYSATQTTAFAASSVVNITCPQAIALHDGDYLMINDAYSEYAAVDGNQTLSAGTATDVNIRSKFGTASNTAALSGLHLVGAQVSFVRPLRLVRYAVVYLPLEDAGNPDNPGGLVPCLMRFETGYPASQAIPDWAGLLVRPATLEGSASIVAQNVTGFTVDFSLDGNFPGVRGATWSDIVTNLNSAINTIYKVGNAVVDTAKPLWYRNYPGVISLKIETRNPVPRTEYDKSAGTPSRKFLYRTQTLMLTPRNFGLDRTL